ncbi:MAG: hypothetical protein JWO69_126 [Thermoleophilia bacterium]|jgi:hypothetical protein|nr:hypothetical protein [Thermoleophilia bacterium]
MTNITLTSTRNSGVVPPWLAVPEPRNSGTVPPWFRPEETTHILPVDMELPLRTVGGETTFVSEPASISPTSLADALRNR